MWRRTHVAWRGVAWRGVAWRGVVCMQAWLCVNGTHTAPTIQVQVHISRRMTANKPLTYIASSFLVLMLDIYTPEGGGGCVWWWEGGWGVWRWVAVALFGRWLAPWAWLALQVLHRLTPKVLGQRTLNGRSTDGERNFNGRPTEFQRTPNGRPRRTPNGPACACARRVCVVCSTRMCCELWAMRGA